jgi:flavin reductase (DIM6/NTAB) family NADH-FMN oxidoreductase RutF
VRALRAAGGVDVGVGLAGVGSARFREVLRQHAAGVAVVTAGTEAPVGFCATSVTSVSLDPPLVLFCVGLGASSWPTLRRAPAVMVHLLDEAQGPLARRFARSASDRFGPETDWDRGPFQLPQLTGVLAWMVLEPVSRTPVGDHAVVVGRVLAAERTPGRRPLLYQDGEFTALAGSGRP